MAKIQKPYSDKTEQYTEAEFVRYCESLEMQSTQAHKDGVFKVMEILDIDEEHSEKSLVDAINYLKKNNGQIESDAPVEFLSERERNNVIQDGKFRSGLYCMLLSLKYSEGMQNKSLFIKDSFKYAFGHQ